MEKSIFFTKPDNSLQLGIIRHKAGYIENPHIHRKVKILPNIQQVLYINKGVVAIDFFDKGGKKLGKTTLKRGDTVLIMSGGHAIRVLENLECLTVKQGPYVGIEGDKIDLIQEGKI
ncbi:MAG: hypothetical protein ACE5IT_02155 [bacterium]